MPPVAESPLNTCMNESSTPATHWYEATRVESAARPRLGYDLDVDVCVIGGGLAGLTTAREVARRGWSVVLIEANRLGSAASGRNSGFVLPGFSEDIDSIVERIGLDHAKQLWALSQDGVAYIRETIRETAMPGVDPADGWLNVSKIDNGRAVHTAVERLRWIGAEVEVWPTARVRQALASAHYFDAMHFPSAFHIHPLNYVLGLARAAEIAGARIFEDTPAVAIDPAGVRKRVQTPSGMVRAAHVVLAGNVQLGALMPRLAATLVPVTTYVVVTEPLGNVVNEVVRYRGAVSDGKRADNHYRVVGGEHTGGERLQWSGRITTRPADPRRFARSLVTNMRRVFPQLGEIKIAHAWSGTLGRAVHRMPQIGEISRGLWVASAFAGHGLNTTAMAGELVARGILENDQTWRLFAPYELVWAGGRLGRVIVRAVNLASRPPALAAESFSRYRERARVRAEARAAQVRAALPAPAMRRPPSKSPNAASTADASGHKGPERRKGSRRKHRAGRAKAE